MINQLKRNKFWLLLKRQTDNKAAVPKSINPKTRFNGKDSRLSSGIRLPGFDFQDPTSKDSTSVIQLPRLYSRDSTSEIQLPRFDFKDLSSAILLPGFYFRDATSKI